MSDGWPDLSRTEAALAAYDADQPRIAALYGAARTSADLTAAISAEFEAANRVREVLALDTADRNSHDRAMRVDMATLRAWVARWRGTG
jgi:hypothetical protein